MSMAAAVVDFYDDASRELMSKIASATSLPPALQEAPFEQLDADRLAELDDGEFGLVVLTKRANVVRKFPLNDPGNAWLSAQYFERTHEKLAFPARFVAATFIKRACDNYGVPAPGLVELYASRADADDVRSNVHDEANETRWALRKMAKQELLEKEASAVEINAALNLPDSQYALVMDHGGGQITRQYALPDVAHVKTAERYFDKHAMEFQPEHRHRFASAVKARATELGIKLASPTIEKWAGKSWNRHVNAHLEQRKSLLPGNRKAHDVLDKLAAAMVDAEPETAAQVLQSFDRQTGLEKYYGRGLQDPYASTMSKAASAWSTEIEGATLTESDLRKVAASNKLAGYLGKGLADQFAKNPVEIFESLPTPEKALIKQIAEGGA